jgi:hypothetical protein
VKISRVTDTRTSPVILIGDFSNAWAMQLTGNLRFALQSGDRIVDHQNPNRASPNLSGTAENPPSDFVVVLRLVQSPIGGFTEFIFDPTSLAKLLKDAPMGWEQGGASCQQAAWCRRSQDVGQRIRLIDSKVGCSWHLGSFNAVRLAQCRDATMLSTEGPLYAEVVDGATLMSTRRVP